MLVITPEVEGIMKSDQARQVEWKRGWEKVRRCPFLVLHMSGTTGVPKPIVYMLI